MVSTFVPGHPAPTNPAPTPEAPDAATRSGVSPLTHCGTAALAARFGVAEATVIGWIRQGVGRPGGALRGKPGSSPRVFLEAAMIGGRWRISAEAVVRFERDCAAMNAPATTAPTAQRFRCEAPIGQAVAS